MENPGPYSSITTATEQWYMTVYAPLSENMTSFAKRGGILRTAMSSVRTEPQSQVKFSENLVKSGHVVFRYASRQRGTQTDRHADRNTLPTYRRQSK